MRLKQIGSNMTRITLADGTELLYSYETPVAGWDAQGAFKTTEKFSVTTTKHIKKYLESAYDRCREESQAFIEGIAVHRRA